MRYYCHLASPIGMLQLIGSEVALQTLHLPAETLPEPPPGAQENETVFTKVIGQLREYFDGRRTTFDLSLAPAGTPFQQEVWQALCQVGYGQTASYGEIATRIGKPKAARAVGMANNRNPIPIIIPCHRIIGKDGSLTGYGGGLAMKTWLLELEQGHRPASLCSNQTKKTD